MNLSILTALRNRAASRVAAAFTTVPPELSAIQPSTWAFIATFAALVLPLGLRSGVLNLKVEKRPAKWLEVRGKKWYKGLTAAAAVNATIT